MSHARRATATRATVPYPRHAAPGTPGTPATPVTDLPECHVCKNGFLRRPCTFTCLCGATAICSTCLATDQEHAAGDVPLPAAPACSCAPRTSYVLRNRVRRDLWGCGLFWFMPRIWFAMWTALFELFEHYLRFFAVWSTMFPPSLAYVLDVAVVPLLLWLVSWVPLAGGPVRRALCSGWTKMKEAEDAADRTIVQNALYALRLTIVVVLWVTIMSGVSRVFTIALLGVRFQQQALVDFPNPLAQLKTVNYLTTQAYYIVTNKEFEHNDVTAVMAALNDKPQIQFGAPAIMFAVAFLLLGLVYALLAATGVARRLGALQVPGFYTPAKAGRAREERHKEFVDARHVVVRMVAPDEH